MKIFTDQGRNLHKKHRLKSKTASMDENMHKKLK
jgi:hypothetical protein